MKKTLLEFKFGKKTPSKKDWANRPGFVDIPVFIKNPKTNRWLKMGTYTYNPQYVKLYKYEVESAFIQDATAVENYATNGYESEPKFDEESFKFFCIDFGYDSDSRRAWGIFRQCIETYKKLKKTGLYDELCELHEND